jgi:NADH:ubiquinone reductase (H+-translocating)
VATAGLQPQDLSAVRIVLLELRDRLLGGFSGRCARTAIRGSRERGVDVRLGSGVARAEADHVVGRRAPVDAHLRVLGLSGVYAIGDVAGAMDEAGALLPQVAPVAMQQGTHVVRHLVDEAAGRPTPPFRYRDKGSMATIGRASAVAELPGRIRLGGVVAWLAWLLLHLLMLVGFKNRASVLASWIWNYATYDHAARLILDQREAATAETVDGRIPRSWAT